MNREEAIEQLQNCKDLIKQDGQDYLDERDFPLLDMAIEALNGTPQGEWIDCKTAKGYVFCSNCNKLTANINRKKYDYCPFCGADMRGGDTE